jgi:hypothetical protein
VSNKGTLEKAFGDQGNPMNLPVAHVEDALPFYERLLGCRVVSRGDTPRSRWSALLVRRAAAWVSASTWRTIPDR